MTTDGAKTPVPLLQIVNWDSTFEKTKSRVVDKCSWVCVPAKQDSIGLLNVLGEPDGAAIYGVWILLVERCVRQPKKREGWLTDNGKRDGRRFTIETLSALWRRQREEIIRMLMVTASRSVGWIAIIEGDLAEYLQLPIAFRERYVDGTALPLIGQNDGSAVALEEKDDASAADLNNNPSGAIAVAARCPHKGKERNGSPLSSPKGDGANDSLQYAEAQSWLNNLFGRKKAWSQNEMHALSEILPITCDHRRLIDWAYSLPRDEQGWSLYDGKQTTKPKQSLTALVEDFNAELDKWTGVRKQLGLNGSYEVNADRHEPDGRWTAARREAAFELFDEAVSFAEPFAKLPAEIQRNIDNRVAHSLARGTSRE